MEQARNEYLMIRKGLKKEAGFEMILAGFARIKSSLIKFFDKELAHICDMELNF